METLSFPPLIEPHNPSALQPERQQLPLCHALLVESVKLAVLTHFSEFLTADGLEGGAQLRLNTADGLRGALKMLQCVPETLSSKGHLGYFTHSSAAISVLSCSVFDIGFLCLFLAVLELSL